MKNIEHIRILQHKETLEEIERGRGTLCPPLHVHIEPTERCIFRCRFCGSHGEEKHKKIISTADFDFTGKRQFCLDRLLRLIDELADVGTKAISFTGTGDPLVYPYMDQVLKRIRERGIQSAVTSVLAMQIRDSLVMELAKTRWVRWSMNAGTVATYAYVHNPISADGAKLFNRVQENIRRINKARQLEDRPCALNASFVISVYNKQDIAPAARLASALGVDSISFRPDTPVEKQSSAFEYDKQTVHDIQMVKQELSSNRFKVYTGGERLEDTQKIGDPGVVCFYSNHQTYIAANGDVYPCCYTRHMSHYSMGSISERDFKGFWFDKNRQANYKKLVFNSCPSCPHGRTNKMLQSLYEGRKTAGELYVPTSKKDYFV